MRSSNISKGNQAIYTDDKFITASKKRVNENDNNRGTNTMSLLRDRSVSKTKRFKNELMVLRPNITNINPVFSESRMSDEQLQQRK